MFKYTSLMEASLINWKEHKFLDIEYIFNVGRQIYYRNNSLACIFQKNLFQLALIVFN